jgi:hypothetical protein
MLCRATCLFTVLRTAEFVEEAHGRDERDVRRKEIAGSRLPEKAVRSATWRSKRRHGISNLVSLSSRFRKGALRALSIVVELRTTPTTDPPSLPIYAPPRLQSCTALWIARRGRAKPNPSRLRGRHGGLEVLLANGNAHELQANTRTQPPLRPP